MLTTSSFNDGFSAERSERICVYHDQACHWAKEIRGKILGGNGHLGSCSHGCHFVSVLRHLMFVHNVRRRLMQHSSQPISRDEAAALCENIQTMAISPHDRGRCSASTRASKHELYTYVLILIVPM
jgi:hypothetical protein